MRTLNMKVGSYQKNYPFEKNQLVDGIEILEDDFVFFEGRYQVKFKCRCGTITYRRLSQLIKMKYKCCNICSRKNNYPEQRKARNHFEESIHKLWLKDILLNLNRGKKTLKCNLTIKDLHEVLIKQNFKCAYTGMDLMIENVFKRDSNASIDRIDSKKDYTKDNIQWVYKPVNIMKNGLSNEEFIAICKSISNFT